MGWRRVRRRRNHGRVPILIRTDLRLPAFHVPRELAKLARLVAVLRGEGEA